MRMKTIVKAAIACIVCFAGGFTVGQLVPTISIPSALPTIPPVTPIPTLAPVAVTLPPTTPLPTLAPVAVTLPPTTPLPTLAPVAITLPPTTPLPTLAPVAVTLPPTTPLPTLAPVAVTLPPTTPLPTLAPVAITLPPTTPLPTMAPVAITLPPTTPLPTLAPVAITLPPTTPLPTMAPVTLPPVTLPPVTLPPVTLPPTIPPPGAVLVCPFRSFIGFDNSRSISTREMRKQVNTIKEMIGISPLGIGSHLSQFGFAHFGAGNTFVQAVNTSQMNVLGIHKDNFAATFDFLSNKNNRVRFSDHREIFDKISDDLIDLVPDPFDPLAAAMTKGVIISGDGEPWHAYTSKRKSLARECGASKRMKLRHPALRVICYNAHKKRKVSRFYKCACDHVIQSSNPKIAARLILGAMCEKPCLLKPPNPCTAFDKITCVNTKKNYLGTDPTTTLDPLTSVTFQHCYWNRRFGCKPRGEVEFLYNLGSCN